MPWLLKIATHCVSCMQDQRDLPLDHQYRLGCLPLCCSACSEVLLAAAKVACSLEGRDERCILLLHSYGSLGLCNGTGAGVTIYGGSPASCAAQLCFPWAILL